MHFYLQKLLLLLTSFHLGGTMSLRLNFNPHLQAEDARVMSQYLAQLNSSLKVNSHKEFLLRIKQ